MFYLKIEDNQIKQAPYFCIRNGFKVYGYNVNEKMMKEDGYTAFEFPADDAELSAEGKIVKKAPEEKSVFTKLEIRRACRALKIEDKLNLILKSDEIFAADWQDASEINLNDDILISALKQGSFTDKEIQAIKTKIGEMK